MNRLDFMFNAEVYGSDRQLGRLAKVSVDPQTWQLTSLIIESGLLFKRAKVIPITKLDNIAAQSIYLTLASSELSEFPDHQEVVVEKGVSQWQRPLPSPDIQIPEPHYSLTAAPQMPVVQEKVRIGVSDELVLLDNKTPVNGLDGSLGHLNQVSTTDSFQVSYLIVAQGKLLAKQVVIPARVVESISERRIHIRASDVEVNEFPEFAAPNNDHNGEIKKTETNPDSHLPEQTDKKTA